MRYQELNDRTFEDAVAYFYEQINRVCSAYVPCKTVTSQLKYPPWYKIPLIKIIKEKSKYHSKFKKYRNISDYESFVILRQRSKELENKLFNDYIAKIESNICQNPKAFWSYVKSKRSSSSYPSTLQFGLVSSSNGEDICNMFGNYFHSNFLGESDHGGLMAHSDQNVDAQSQSNSHLCNIEICEKEVLKLLANVDLNKSAGPDSIPPLFIKKCATSLTVPLTILFTRSFIDGLMPNIWKRAYITPIHKKGPKDRVENYRPISKLCVFAKILEKIVHKQVYSALKLDFSE